MILQAICIGIIGMCATFEWALGTNLASRPIITGIFVGLVLGDLRSGIVLGGLMEMVFIGSVTMGAAVPPDSITGGILGIALAISAKNGAGMALLLAFPIARIYLFIDNFLTLHLFPVFLKKADRCIEKGDFKGMEKIHMVSGFVIKSLPRGIVCGIAFYLGTPVLRWIFGILPAFVQEGLAVTMEYIPALGIAILATMTLTGKTAVYFILGFALAAYLKVPVIGVTILAVCMAVILVQLQDSGQTVTEQEEDEDF